jgi:hypothetical protein
MEAVFISGGEDGNGGHAHFFTGADNPQGNFAPVGYQYFRKHSRPPYSIRAKEKSPTTATLPLTEPEPLAAGLGHNFTKNNTGYDRVSREMTLQKKLIAFNGVASGGGGIIYFFSLVNQEHRLPVRQDLL